LIATGRSLRLCALILLALRPALGDPTSADTIRVFAASSLTDAFRQLGTDYEKARPGDRVEFSFAGSQILRTQIEQGAPADLFASADLAQMEPLRGQRLVEAPRVFAHNGLMVVTPAASGKVRRLQDLARPGIRLVVAGPTVPVGRYTAQVLGKLEAAMGPGFRKRAAANVVSQELNVRAVLSKVALGEADAGFVYATDAKAAGSRVRVLPVPSKCNVVAAYPLAVVARGPAKENARVFAAFVLGSRGQAVLRRFGFAR
jgi:molybdate transport system substrate-binding protein